MILNLIDPLKLTVQQLNALSRISGLLNQLGRAIADDLEHSRARMLALASVEECEMWVVSALAETVEV